MSESPQPADPLCHDVVMEWPPPGPTQHRVREREPRDRTEYERDRDRVLYSSAFARLAGVTQVATPGPGQEFHNRMTHTLKVAQLSARFARVLHDQYHETIPEASTLDRDAAEAAALSHDLGHPPFGHLGEATLCSLADECRCGGFEANPQAFRVVTRLARRSVRYSGLNLTRFTLEGMLKYPWLRAGIGGGPVPSLATDKWGAFEDDVEMFNFARSESPDAVPPRDGDLSRRSLTAQLIDWADDITYAVHDVEDFYRAGLMPLSDLVWRKNGADAFRDSFLDDDGNVRPKFDGLSRDLLETAVDGVQKHFSLGFGQPYDGSSTMRALVRLGGSHLIGRYFEATTLTQAGGRANLHVDDTFRAEIAVLKELLWFYVIDRPSLAAIQHGQRKAMTVLFGLLTDAARNRSEWRVFPPPVQEALAAGPSDGRGDVEEQARARLVIDFIAGMTDHTAWWMYTTLAGIAPTELSTLR